MEIVSISRSKFDKLEPLELPKNVRNTECEVFHFRYRNKDKVLKKLYCIGGNNFGNKLYTIEALSSNASFIPDNFILPEFLVTIDKRIEAFVMPYVKGINLSVILDDCRIDLDEKKYYLKMIGQILEQMSNIRKYTTLTDFYLGDLHEDNFIIDPLKRDVYIADTDSIKIAGNFSSPSRYLNSKGLLNSAGKKYHLIRDVNSLTDYVVDENTDLYCYVIVILNYLYGENINSIGITEFYRYLNYLNDLQISKNLLECFERIVSNGNNVNPVNYIDDLTAKQIGMARKKVYNLRK